MGYNRIDKESYYLNIAKTVSERSTCLRRHYGAVIVKNDEVIATGYNGAPRGEENCIDIGTCTREELGVAKGERYELCLAVHAEQNAIISASRDEMQGATIYVCGIEVSTGEYANPTPCKLCRRMIVNAGIVRCVGLVDGEPKDISLDKSGEACETCGTCHDTEDGESEQSNPKKIKSLTFKGLFP